MVGPATSAPGHAGFTVIKRCTKSVRPVLTAFKPINNTHTALNDAGNMLVRP